tara:strand:+ start:1887 stop:2060 length:174 start_codon:yes stop_codon:yes gene_type:complete
MVYYEIYGTPYEAIQREKRQKKWKRAWKKEQIEQVTPKWTYLYTEKNTIGPLEGIEA